jgi:dTDP-4-dehydrorhamnose 3,5-epimerase
VRTEPTTIPGCVLVHLTRSRDDRGDFVKVFRRDVYETNGLDPQVSEFYWSTSRHGVVRGLHFQSPPHEHAKTVTVVSGSVHDVVLDLRAGSPTFGEHAAFTLSDAEPVAVHVPVGCAHGFQVTSAEATVAYLVSTEHAPEHDLGVRWDTARIDWPIDRPVLSPRDAAFPALSELETPFRR